MKVWRVTYKINGMEYTKVFLSKNMRTVKFKLSMNHHCDMHAIKILNSEIMLDSKRGMRES